MTVRVPDSHQDLLQKPIHAVLTTMMPDGQPQSSIVWADYDGEYVLINTTLERQKGRNMCANRHVSVLAIDPANTSRWVEVVGEVVEMTQAGAEAHADKLAMRYDGKAHFYGEVLPLDQKYKETRVIVKIAPVKVSVDAVFK